MREEEDEDNGVATRTAGGEARIALLEGDAADCEGGEAAKDVEFENTLCERDVIGRVGGKERGWTLATGVLVVAVRGDAF